MGWLAAADCWRANDKVKTLSKQGRLSQVDLVFLSWILLPFSFNVYYVGVKGRNEKNKKHHHSDTDALEKIKGDLSAFNSNNTALQVLDFSSLERSMKMLELSSRLRRGKIHIIHTYTCVCVCETPAGAY